jgi:hypothetical protein
LQKGQPAFAPFSVNRIAALRVDGLLRSISGVCV